MTLFCKKKKEGPFRGFVLASKNQIKHSCKQA